MEYIAMTMSLLTRIAQALERLAPVPKQGPQLSEADAFIWTINTLIPIQHVNRVDIDVLKGIERVKIQLLENTARFAYGWPANNALLWGARGMGKSSLIKAVHHKVNKHEKIPHPLKLIEIHREEIETLPALMAQVDIFWLIAKKFWKPKKSLSFKLFLKPSQRPLAADSAQ
jgi:predicted AAA+ superfamily ATPase